MKISFSQYGYEAEKRAVANEIVSHLRSIGVKVETKHYDLGYHPGYERMLRDLAKEGLEITVEV